MKKFELDKGYTLVEVAIAMIIASIVIGTIFSAFVNGVSTDAKAKTQDQYQSSVQKVMYQIVDGTEKNKGLRAAKRATILDDSGSNIVFVAGTKNIIYFLDDGSLYRGASDSVIEEIPDVDDCEKVLDHVGEFTINIDGKTVTIKIEIEDPQVKDVELETEVTMRNAL